MIIISYDISDDRIRGRFSKMLTKNGAIRLQYSVYEVNNTKRILDTIIMKIESRFRDKFSGADSILIFTADCIIRSIATQYFSPNSLLTTRN